MADLGGPFGYGTGGPFGDGFTVPAWVTPEFAEIGHNRWLAKIKQEQKEQSAIDRQTDNANNQMLYQTGAMVTAPVLGAAGLAAGNYLFNSPTALEAGVQNFEQIAKLTDLANKYEGLAPQINALIASNGGATTGIGSLAPGVTTAGSVISSAAPEGMMAVGTAADGSTVFAPAAAGLEAPTTILGSETLGAALPYMGTAAGLAGFYDTFSNKKHGWSGALEGAGSGALIGGSWGGPVGAGVGALVGGGLGYFGNFGDEDRYLDEYNRAQDLRDKGIKWAWNATAPEGGRSKEELIAAEQAKLDAGQYGNVDFARTRDESYLKPQDIVGYSFLPETLGNTYAEASLDDQLAMAGEALRLGVREHHGTIDFTGDEEALRKFVEDRLANKDKNDGK